MCCVHNGIISESEIDKYKKTEIPKIIENKLKSLYGDENVEVSANDINFGEDGQLDETPMVIE